MARRTPGLLALVRSIGQDTNHDVLDAALISFLDFGIRRTSMGEIAKRAGMSPATLYRRFAQKSDIVQMVGLREVRRFVDSVEAHVDHSAPADDQLVELFVAFADGLRSNQLIRRLLDTEPEIVLPFLTTQGGPVLALGTEYITEFIERLQDAGQLPHYDARPVAEALARVALTMPLIPETSIPIGDSDAARQFARDHLVVIARAAPPAKRTPRKSSA